MARSERVLPSETLLPVKRAAGSAAVWSAFLPGRARSYVQYIRNTVGLTNTPAVPLLLPFLFLPLPLQARPLCRPFRFVCRGPSSIKPLATTAANPGRTSTFIPHAASDTHTTNNHNNNNNGLLPCVLIPASAPLSRPSPGSPARSPSLLASRVPALPGSSLLAFSPPSRTTFVTSPRPNPEIPLTRQTPDLLSPSNNRTTNPPCPPRSSPCRCPCPCPA